jgi:hypothetical protein
MRKWLGDHVNSVLYGLLMMVTIQTGLLTLATQNRDPYDLRQPPSEPFPPEYYVNYLQTPSVASAIGAETTYVACASEPFEDFVESGDVRVFFRLRHSLCLCVELDALQYERTLLPQLSNLANSGLRILIWVGPYISLSAMAQLMVIILL